MATRPNPDHGSADYLALGRAVRDLRERRGVSQHVASFDAGRGPTYFGRLERGIASPTFGTLLWIARMFAVTVEELVVRYDWHLHEIDPHAGRRVPLCPTPAALALAQEVNDDVYRRHLRAMVRGRMRSWT